MRVGLFFVPAVLSLGLVGFGVGTASAQSVRQKCSSDYQAAKTANTLAGASWNDFYSKCSAGLRAGATPAATPAVASVPNNPLKPTPAAATTTVAATPAAAPAPMAPPAAAPTTAAAPAKPMSAGRLAFTQRERQCGSEWRANAALKTQYGSWPKYLSACNTRLKASAQ